MLILAATWIGLFVTAFSFAATKLPSYVTPCYPALALIYGHWLWQVASQPQAAQPRWLLAGLGVGSAVGLAIVLALGGLSMPPLPELRPLVLVGFALLIGSLLGLALARRGQTQLAIRSYAVGAAIMVALLFSIGPALASRSRSDLTMLVERFTKFPAEQYVALGGGEPSWLFYAGRPIPELGSNDLPEAVAALEAGHCVIARSEQARRLRQHCNGLGMPVEEIAAAPRFLEDDDLHLLRQR
jgi:4-amino-4-deoxy-L-arabinose transferase-like glycosyltransferase